MGFVQMYKKKKLNTIAPIAFLSMILLVFLTNSCKEPSPTTLEVTAVNANGTLLSNAKIWLVAEPTDTAHNAIPVKDSAWTNDAGKANFDLSSFYKAGQIGVMQIKVKGFYFGLTGEAIAEITEEQRNQVLVQIQ